ncbi:MAG: biotin--[acetyl-CoA-carboxylase] ligase [Candidatus Aminicenantales bacterium]|jgi:BirA family biotin operon repressor/biotin-[acetyl-CoA-carboxylase] ligase
MTLGTIIHRLESVPSTNDAARDLVRDGAAHGTVVVAAEQSRGRGTKGRSWHSPRGLGLYASFILRWEGPGGPGELFPLLPLAAGLAAAEAVLASAGFEALLKWPNDLVHERKKLGGILTEGVFRAGAPGHAIVGIGINVNHGEADFPEDLRALATSVRLVTGRPADAGELLAHLCQSLDSWYNSLIRGGRDKIIRGAEDRMAFSPGTRVRMATARDEIRGVYRGLTPEGRLRLDRPGRPESFPFEEILALDWE